MCTLMSPVQKTSARGYIMARGVIPDEWEKIEKTIETFESDDIE